MELQLKFFTGALIESFSSIYIFREKRFSFLKNQFLTTFNQPKYFITKLKSPSNYSFFYNNDCHFNDMMINMIQIMLH